MSDTPEIDHLENNLGKAAEMSHPTLWAFARRLERERDGWREAAYSLGEAIPPSWEELVTRLESRGTDSAERRAHRLALAQEELAHAPNFDHRIVNHSVTQVLSELVSLAS
jgi:guanylate kinase